MSKAICQIVCVFFFLFLFVEALAQSNDILAWKPYTHHADFSFEDYFFMQSLKVVANKAGTRLVMMGLDVGPAGINRMIQHYQQQGKWLYGKNIVEIPAPATGTKDDIREIIDYFAGDITGIIAWDPNVPATSNVAFTVAAAYPGSVVAKKNGDWYNYLTTQKGKLVIVDLAGMFDGTKPIQLPNSSTKPSTRDPNVDAYLWALENYLKPNRIDYTQLCYLPDIRNSGAGPETFGWIFGNSHEVCLLKKAFVFYLKPWNEPPRLKLDQQTYSNLDNPYARGKYADYAVFHEILHTVSNKLQQGEIFTVWGWYDKDTGLLNTARTDYDSTILGLNEFQLQRWISYYGGTLAANIEGSPTPLNPSFWATYPSTDKPFNQSFPTSLRTNLENKIYILLNNGDGGAPGGNWFDASRTAVDRTIPVNWLSDTDANGFEGYYNYFFETKTNYDYILPGPIGWHSIMMNWFKPSKFSDLMKIFSKSYFKFNTRHSAWIGSTDYTDWGYAPIGSQTAPAQNIESKIQKYSQFSDALVNLFVWDPADSFVRPQQAGFPAVDGFPQRGSTQFLTEPDKIFGRLLSTFTINRDCSFVVPGRPPGGALMTDEDIERYAQNLATFCVLNKSLSPQQPHFFVIRFGSIGQPVSKISKFIDFFKQKVPAYQVEALDPYNYFSLYRRHIAGNNEINYYKLSFLDFWARPSTANPARVEFYAKIRNEGWDTWQENGNGQNETGETFVRVKIFRRNTGQFVFEQWFPATRAGQPIQPGQILQMQQTIPFDLSAGNYDLNINMVKKDFAWFADNGNLSLRIEFSISAQSTQENCSNIIDDDLDGLIDCADATDCRNGTICCPTGTNCSTPKGKCNLTRQCITAPTANCPDAKTSGLIDIFDLATIVKQMNSITKDLFYDVTNDGAININDLQATAQKIGTNCQIT